MEREFKGVWISKAIWLDSRLNALDKVILAEVDSLDQTETGCFASNQYIAEFCQCSETKVSNSISKLVKLGYLQVKSFDGRTRILHSRIAELSEADLQNLQGRLTKFARQTYKICKADSQKMQGTNNNNIDSNTDIKTESKRDTSETSASDPGAKESAKVSEVTKKVIDRLNQLTGSAYRSNTDSTKKLIKRLLKDGYTEVDIIAVIEKMVYLWNKVPEKGEKDMRPYLRPVTLFGSKFGDYLGLVIPAESKGERSFDVNEAFSRAVDRQRKGAMA